MPRLPDRTLYPLFTLAAGLVALAGCGNGTVIGSGPLPTPTPATPKVSFEYKVPTANSQPLSIVRGIDGFLYFTEQAASQIGQLTTGGSFKEIKTTTPAAAPFGITVNNSAGTIWFTERAVHKVATVIAFTATIPITEYTVPWANSTPTFIASGSNQNTMYFVDPGANAIGEVNTSGSFSGPFAIPTANANPGTFPTGSIALGADNNMWFAEYNAAKIGHFNTTTNAVDAEFALTAGANPTTIILASDNAVWFTENNAAAPKLGRISMSGVMNEYPLTGAKSATGLAQDAAGEFVIADPVNNAIGRFNPNSLDYTEFAIPTANSGAAWITIGPDSRMYFTETAVNQIGQFSYF